MTKQELFLDWFNNFLTVERFAEYYNLTIEQARRLIEEGRKLHEEGVKKCKPKI